MSRFMKNNAGQLIPRDGKLRFDRQTPFSAVLTATIILALLTLLVATEPNPGEASPPAEDNFTP